MYSPKEKEIIEKCLSISAWNYRVSKYMMTGKGTDADILRGKVRREILTLSRLMIDQNCLETKITPPTMNVDGKVEKRGLRISGFFRKLIGRDL